MSEIKENPHIDKISAGAIIFNNEGRIALVSQRGGNSWSLPKGGVEPGETILQATLREITEETGLILSESDILLKYKPYKRKAFSSHGEIVKLMCISLIILPDSPQLKPRDNQNPSAGWCTLIEAKALLDYKEDIGLLERTMTLFRSKKR